MTPTPADAVAAELARALEHEPRRELLQQYLSTAAIELVSFNIALVGRNLADQVSRDQLPGVAAIDYLVSRLLDSTFGASEADAHISLRIAGNTHFGYGRSKYLGQLPPEFMARPVRVAVRSIVGQVARTLA